MVIPRPYNSKSTDVQRFTGLSIVIVNNPRGLQGDYEGAAACYEAALNLDPSNQVIRWRASLHRSFMVMPLLTYTMLETYPDD